MNELVRYVFLYIGLVVATGKIFDNIYTFQVKEYRFDRFLSFFKEVGVYRALYQIDVRFPAKSMRNMLILVLSVLALCVIAFILQTLYLTYIIVFIAIAPFVSLATVSFFVALTEIPAQFKRRAIIAKARRYLVGKKVVAIGITGSYGKTSTKEYLAHILSQRFSTAKTEDNMNTDVGIALSALKNISDNTEYFVMEVGAYTKGEIERACRVISPTYAVLTAIGNQHLSLFGSKENLVSAKKELLQAVEKDGSVYINAQILEKDQLSTGIQARKVFYSASGAADITMRQGRAVYKNIEVKLPPIANADNLLPCVAIAVDLGMTKPQIEKALKSLPKLLHKVEKKKGAHKGTLITDTANSSVEGFISALSALEGEKGGRIVVSKGIIELGSEKEASYRKILDAIKKAKATLFTTDPLFEILDMDQVVVYLKNEKLLLAKLADVTTTKTAILLEGRFTPSFIRKLS